MKVLFIGVLFDGTGWANAGINYVLALDAAGIDVVPRSLKLNNTDGEVPERILELEAKSEKGCDVCIQCLLPHHMEFNGNFKKNIGMIFTETSHFRNSSWGYDLNKMDEVWVPCTMQQQTLRNSYVDTPSQIIPCATDTSVFEKKYDVLDVGCSSTSFKFYTIGELNRRKNLPALLKAFHLEFGLHEDVELIIKAHLPGASTHTSENHLKEICSQIKKGLKLYRTENEYKSETLITKRLTNEEMMQLHHTCDCFVMPSYGEGFCLPAFSAMGMGKTPICSRVGGIHSFLEGEGIGNDSGILVDTHSEPVFGMNDTFPDLFLGNEDWQQIDINSLRSHMRYMYEDKEYREELAKNGKNRVYDFSYNAVGNMMKDALGNELSRQKRQKWYDFTGVCNRTGL